MKSVDFSASGSTHLVTACNDKSIRIFDLTNYTSDPLQFTGHTSSIKKCIFLGDEGSNQRVASISDDKTLRVWDTVSKSEVKHLKFESAPNSIELSRDSKWVIVAVGSSVEIYDAATFDLIKKFTIPSKVSAASIHPDKSVFVCGSEDFTLYKYSIESGAELG